MLVRTSELMLFNFFWFIPWLHVHLPCYAVRMCFAFDLRKLHGRAMVSAGPKLMDGRHILEALRGTHDWRALGYFTFWDQVRVFYR